MRQPDSLANPSPPAPLTRYVINKFRFRLSSAQVARVTKTKRTPMVDMQVCLRKKRNRQVIGSHLPAGRLTGLLMPDAKEDVMRDATVLFRSHGIKRYFHHPAPPFRAVLLCAPLFSSLSLACKRSHALDLRLFYSLVLSFTLVLIVYLFSSVSTQSFVCLGASDISHVSRHH